VPLPDQECPGFSHGDMSTLGCPAHGSIMSAHRRDEEES
jgi:hypothetical protein